jgi:hypothetical protein
MQASAPAHPRQSISALGIAERQHKRRAHGCAFTRRGDSPSVRCTDDRVGRSARLADRIRQYAIAFRKPRIVRADARTRVTPHLLPDIQGEAGSHAIDSMLKPNLAQ